MYQADDNLRLIRSSLPQVVEARVDVAVNMMSRYNGRFSKLRAVIRPFAGWSVT